MADSSPKTKTTKVPLFLVSVDGVHLSLPLGRRGEKTVEARALSFRYEDCERGDDLLELQLVDPKLELIDGPHLQEGRTIQVRWGYAGALSPMRTCVVKEVEPDFGPEVTVRVKAYDRGSDLKEGASDQVFSNTTYSGIAEQIAERHRLRPVVDETETVHEAVPQGHATDYELLQRLADRIGFVFYVENNELHFRRAKRQTKARFTLSYRTGRSPNVLRFSPKSSSRKGGGGQTKTTVKGFDLDGKRAVEAVADTTTPTDKVGGSNVFVSALTGEFEGLFEDSPDDSPTVSQAKGLLDVEASWPGPTMAAPVANEEEARTVAKARKTRAESKCWEARVTVEGSPMYAAKQPFEVQGVGRKYGGLWWAKTVTHRIDASGYLCELELTRQGSSVSTGKSAKSAGQANTEQTHDDHLYFGEEMSWLPEESDEGEPVRIDAETGEVSW